MTTRKWTRILSVMLLASLLLATVSVAYAAQGSSSQTAASCCGGFPPCHTQLSKCGWCCIGILSLMGYIDIDYDANCNPTVTGMHCGFPCGLFGCSP
jgi:hypothetical protein